MGFACSPQGPLGRARTVGKWAQQLLQAEAIARTLDKACIQGVQAGAWDRPTPRPLRALIATDKPSGIPTKHQRRASGVGVFAALYLAPQPVPLGNTGNMSTAGVVRLPQAAQRAHRRPWRQCCRAAAAGGGGSSGGGSDDVRARIARAREYKKSAVEQQQGVAPQSSPAATTAAAAAPQASGADVEAAFSDAAQQLAAKEEASFLQAVAEASRTASSAAGAAPASPSSSSQAGGQAEAVLARINAARKYKQQPEAGQPSSSPAVNAGSSSSGSSSSSSADGGGVGAAASQQSAAQQVDAEQERSFRTGAGGAEQAANWLRFAEGSGAAAAQIDKSLSAEQFTLAKEELIKQQEVEIVTVDAAYAERLRQEKAAQQAAAQQAEAGAAAAAEVGEAAQQEGEDIHKPVVPTWGVSAAAATRGLRGSGHCSCLTRCPLLPQLEPYNALLCAHVAPVAPAGQWRLPAVLPLLLPNALHCWFPRRSFLDRATSRRHMAAGAT